jgi:hypothetical protein
MSLASAGDTRLVGIISDYAQDNGPRLAEENWHYQHIIEKARRSGMKNIPNATAGAGTTLTKPASGLIEETVPIDTPGSRLIVEEAKKRTSDAISYRDGRRTNHCRRRLSRRPFYR